MKSLILELKSALENIPMSIEDQAKINEILGKIEVAKTPQQKMELFTKWLSIFGTLSKIVYDVGQNI